MRVLLFANSAWCIYNLRRNLVRNLLRAGHSVIVVAPEDQYSQKLVELGAEHYGISLKPTNLNPVRELFALFSLLKTLRKIRPDFVFSFTIKCNVYAGICRPICGYAQVANVSGLGQGFDKSGLLNKVVCLLYKISLRGSQRVFFQNKEDLDFCISKRLVPFEICERIPGSGVDLNYFSPTIRKIGGNGNGNGNGSGQSRVFLMFGRLVPKKGYDDYLLAARVLKAKYGNQVEFRVLGIEDKNRAESRELLERLKQGHEEGSIVFYPETDDVLPQIREADIVVLPSRYNEGVPHCLLEALACAKPVITTDWKGCRETVVDGLNGALVPVEDPLVLSQEMDRMVEASDIRLFEMGRFSRELAEKKFDENLVIASYLRELQLSTRDATEEVEIRLPERRQLQQAAND